MVSTEEMLKPWRLEREGPKLLMLLMLLMLCGLKEREVRLPSTEEMLLLIALPSTEEMLLLNQREKGDCRFIVAARVQRSYRERIRRREADEAPARLPECRGVQKQTGVFRSEVYTIK